jgi:2-desacetyl-2-hydroxyethyl bacteriochlorophyllide A dehydrogenase
MFNEERRLPALLRALARQHYRDFEVVVVDSGSFDQSPWLARESGARLIEIDSRDFTFGHSLNVGIAAAQGDLIAIVSAHAEPVDDGWLGALMAALRRPDVAMVYGRQVGGPLSRFSESLDFQRDYREVGYSHGPPNFAANNANSAIVRALWDEHRFDETLTGLEDAEWARYWMQHGREVVYEPRAAVYHIHEETWTQVQRRYYREAVTLRRLKLRGPADAPRMLAREARRLIADLASAARQGRLVETAPEVVRYRAEKAWGTARGLLSTGAEVAQDQNEALYFGGQGRAVVIHGPNQASLEHVSVPALNPSEILVRVAWEGVCGTDLELAAGRLGYYESGLGHYPITPGHEFSGWVARVGANVRGLNAGDPVVVECIQSCGSCEQCLRGNNLACIRRSEIGVIGRNGAYADYVVTPARFAHLVPEGLDLRRAALCEPTAVVLKGLKRIQWALAAEKKPRCAVVGAGTIGHLCARILSARGHQVTAFDRSSARLSHFTDGAVETASDLLELSRFDVVIEATGDPDALHRVLAETRPGATVLLLGLPYSRREFSFESVVADEKAIIGSLGSGAAEYDEALGLLPTLQLDAFLQHELPLERYAEAWAGFRGQPGLKTLLRVNG